jgi:flagellar motor switch protein FliG
MLTQEFSGIEKASMLLLSLGASASAQVFQHLSQAEIERLTSEIVKIREVAPELKKSILGEFERVRSESTDGAKPYIVSGLADANDQEHNVQSSMRTRNFQFLCGMSKQRVASVLRDESPQVIALVLTNLPPDEAADVLAELDNTVQQEVASRIYSMGAVEQEVIGAVESALRAGLVTESARTAPKAYEWKPLPSPVENNNADSKAFAFDDIANLDSTSIRRLIEEVAEEDLYLALKGADTHVIDVVLSILPAAISNGLKNDLSSAQPFRIVDIDRAQTAIEETAIVLLARGEIALNGSTEGAL